MPAPPITFFEFQSLVVSEHGVRVTRVHAIGNRLWIETKTADSRFPFVTLYCDPCAAFLDSGVAGRAISRASLGRTTDIGADAARVLGRPEVATWLELRLQAADERARQLRAVTREVIAIPGTLEIVTS